MEKNNVLVSAIGHAIDIGSIYGYSKNSGGFSYITIGEAVKKTNNKVVLKIISKKRCLYDGEFEKIKHGKTVSIRSEMIFPINEKDI
jgi:hypothetical protein